MCTTVRKLNVTKRKEETQQHCQCRMCQIFCTCSPTSCRHFSCQCRQVCDNRLTPRRRLKHTQSLNSDGVKKRNNKLPRKTEIYRHTIATAIVNHSCKND
uniref:Uncharacterized protein n=1 Tax=Rhipicephalus zambeziensis TaxID=60191 RepID=A0A224YEE4_9ACAR